MKHKLIKTIETHEVHYLVDAEDHFHESVPHFSERLEICNISEKILTESQYNQYLEETKDPLFGGR